MKLRVPLIQKSELVTLAEVGALNFISGKEGGNAIHRRDALWQIERAARSAGPLLRGTPTLPRESRQEIARAAFSDPGQDRETPPDTHRDALQEQAAQQTPLLPMTPEERLVADFRGTGISAGPHPMSFHRERLKKHKVRSAMELRHLPNGSQVRIAGGVIARQRPGTANGFVFLSLEDETGIANAVITPQLFDRYHVIVVHQQFLLIDGELQNQEGVISVKAGRIRPLRITRARTISHDFH